MSTANIKVLVRPRPIDEAKKEKWAAGFEIHGRRITLGAKTYDPDVTLAPTSTQEEVFDHCSPIIEAVKDGSNGTIMVYGQTGTGKTHTMLGSSEDGDTSGIAFRAIESLLNHVRTRTLAGDEIAVSLAILEIYNERISDMLSSTADEVQLIGGLPRSTTKVTLTSIEQASQVVQQGLSSRHVTATAMNDRSSRSHVILMLDLFTIVGEQSYVAHLFLVDLAGSESVKKSAATGKAAAEAGVINRSLLALKTVILTLSQQSEAPGGQRPHIPYRDSRLTELLQDSIGGSARTMLVACVSGNGRDVEETKSTLEYASKARAIRNVLNTERDKLTARIRGLEIELQKSKNRLSDKMNERGGYFVSREEHDEIQRQRDELVQLKACVEEERSAREGEEARKHVSMGQAGLYQAMIDEKEAQLQVSRRNFADAILAFQRTTSEVTQQIGRVLGRVDESCRNDLHRVEAFAKGVATDTLSLAAPLFQQTDAALRAMWNEAHRSHVEQVKVFLGYQQTLQEQQLQTQAKYRDNILAALEVAQKALAVQHTVVRSSLRDCETETAEHLIVSNDIAHSAFDRIAAALPVYSGAAILSNFVAESRDLSVAQLSGAATRLSDDTCKSLIDAKRAIAKPGRETIHGVLQTLSSVDATAAHMSPQPPPSVTVVPPCPAVAPPAVPLSSLPPAPVASALPPTPRRVTATVSGSSPHRTLSSTMGSTAAAPTTARPLFRDSGRENLPPSGPSASAALMAKRGRSSSTTPPPQYDEEAKRRQRVSVSPVPLPAAPTNRTSQARQSSQAS